jgi:hypothetical protein
MKLMWHNCRLLLQQRRKRRWIQARLAMDVEEKEEGKVEWSPTPIAITSCYDPKEEHAYCCCSSSRGGKGGGSKFDLRWMRKKKKRGKWSGLQLSLQQQSAMTQEKNLQIAIAAIAEEEKEEDPSSTCGGCRRRRRGESGVVSNSRCNNKLL